jgi:hypothetical protein
MSLPNVPCLRDCQCAECVKIDDHVVEMQYAHLADELIRRIGAVPAVDRDHLEGVRMIRNRINQYLANLHDFERSGVTS